MSLFDNFIIQETEAKARKYPPGKSPGGCNNEKTGGAVHQSKGFS